ncbi:MAG: hypothetical protein WBW94_16490 [Anaerolineales bacterium]
MKTEKFRLCMILANLLIINGFVIYYLNLTYPFVGHDYDLAIPSLLDTALHFRLNGLAIQWFTPSFGGGIPAFPNPNNMQFSLPAFLSVFLFPWQAIILSVIMYVSVGFIACEYFLRHTLKLNWTSSILGAAFFSVNGFIIDRVVVGHLGYHTFPILPIFLILLLDESLSPLTAAVFTGVIAAILIQSAGYFIIILFALSILMTLPIVYVYNTTLFKWKRWLIILSGGGVIGLFISASKLAAIYSFMRFFPRTLADYYPTTIPLGIFGLMLQLLGTMNLAPLFQMIGLNPNSIPNYILSATRADYGYWEMDMSLSPVVFFLLLIGTDKFFHHPKKYLSKLIEKNRMVAVLLLVLFSWLAIEFTLAKGIIYPLLQHLPILSSLHVNIRFAAAFIFPLAFIAVLIYNRWLGFQRSSLIFMAVNILTLLPLGAYLLLKSDLFYRIYDIRTGQEYYNEMQSGAALDVTSIGLQNDNTQALISHSSNLNLYEPIFGYGLENFHPEVTPGSVWNISDGYYNMTDPTGYVYPEINGNRPFERFHVIDKNTLALFLKHIQPAWRIPFYQQLLDWVSSLGFFIATAYLVFYFCKRLFFKPS